jgi:mono/diheme cytochrome c family protein
MKINRFFGLLMILASAFLFVNCTSDPVPGPPGADGTDGIDGIDGTDGVDGTASCVSCHSNATREPIFEAFALSAHGKGTTYQRGTRASCAQCHGSDGFIDYVTTGAVQTAPVDDRGNVLAYTPAMPVSCNTCHDSHRTFDFENDGPDYALRNPDPSDLVLAPGITVDFGDASNNCITCHQPRNSYDIPTISPDGTYEITSLRFGPHHGPQSTMLEGILGAEVPGPEGYPARGSAIHRTASSCVECHMGDATAVEEGGHSWAFVESLCIQCHGAVPGSSNSFTNDYPELFGLLTQVEGIDPDGNPITGILYEEFDEDDEGILVRSVYANEGVWPDVAAMAAWNYKTVQEDQSRGIHNPKYTEALMKNSIEAVRELLNQD